MRTMKLRRLGNHEVATGGWTSVAEMAINVGVSKQTVLNRIRSGKLEAAHFHGLTMVKRTDE